LKSRKKSKYCQGCQVVNHKAHCWLDRQLIGQEFPWVHTIKDLPVRTFGFKHRYAMHDSETALLLYLLSGKASVYVVSVLHDAVDKASRVRKKKPKPSNRFGRTTNKCPKCGNVTWKRGREVSKDEKKSVPFTECAKCGFKIGGTQEEKKSNKHPA
jgi:DNA-directed RNA polymerase subunit M/transcription elongation factor TFIIS